MLIEDWCQVNSNFFFSKSELEFDGFKNYKKLDVNVKKLTQTSLNNMFSHFVFDTKDNIIKLTTNHGNFVFYGVTQEFEPNQIKEMLNTYSKDTLYYFNNVDYFTYGCFGVASNNKIERLLRYNSEASSEEDEITWVGKAHLWETETHTYYSKQRLTEGEMSFGWEEVCEMVLYYLPFVSNDVNILGMTVYSNSQYLKEDITNLLSEKPVKNHDEFSVLDENDLFKSLVSNNTRQTISTVVLKKDKLIFFNKIVSVDVSNLFNNDVKFFTNTESRTIKYSNLNFENFYGAFLAIVRAYKNARLLSPQQIQSAMSFSEQSDGDVVCNLVTNYNYASKKYSVNFVYDKIFDEENNVHVDYRAGQESVGDKFDRKTAEKVYKIIIKSVKKHYNVKVEF